MPTEGEIQRVRRTKSTYPDIDFTKPINTKEFMAKADDEDCFTHLWDVENKLCAVCADSEICGVIYHGRQNRKVKALEKESGGFMDMVKFDEIERDKLLMWLSLAKRTVAELFERVQEISQCPDDTTVKYWVKSFIVDHPRLSTKGGIVIVKPK